LALFYIVILTELLKFNAMQSAIIHSFAWILARIPLRANHAVGAIIGWIAWVSRSKLRTISEINLQLCFPDMDADQRSRIAKASLLETGKALCESFWLWTQPPEKVSQLISITEGESLLRDAQQSGRGVIIAAPHLGAWEACCLPLVVDKPVACLYQPPKQPAMETLTINGRINLGALPTKLDPQGIKSILSKLKAGETVGILPDQEPDLQNGCFAPFFNVPANTITLLARFASRTDAQVLLSYAERLPKGAGWHVKYFVGDANVSHSDKLIATTAINKGVETCILDLPEQYMWNYKRFRMLPDGTRRNYKTLP